MAENEIVEQKQTFSEVMLAELENKKDALVKGFNKERFVMNAVSLLNDKPELQKFGAGQLKMGLLKGAVLDVDFFRNEAYLIGYGSQLQFQLSYTGMKKLVKKYSVRPVKDINAEIVRDGDKFEKEVSDKNTNFSFQPKPFNDGEIIGAFAYIQFADGGCIVEEMTKKEIDMTRSKSKSKGAMAWSDFYGEMAKKVVTRRLCKKCELSFENNEQMSLFNDDTAIDTTASKPKVDNPFDDADGLEEI